MSGSSSDSRAMPPHPWIKRFEGLDTLTRLTEDIPNFWDATLDPALTPDVLPLLPDDTPPLPTPLDSAYLTTDSLFRL
jgi:hypothetical protein